MKKKWLYSTYVNTLGYRLVIPLNMNRGYEVWRVWEGSDKEEFIKHFEAYHAAEVFCDKWV